MKYVNFHITDGYDFGYTSRQMFANDVEDEALDEICSQMARQAAWDAVDDNFHFNPQTGLKEDMQENELGDWYWDNAVTESWWEVIDENGFFEYLTIK